MEWRCGDWRRRNESKKEKKSLWISIWKRRKMRSFNFSLFSREREALYVWLLRCWREVVAVPSTGFGDISFLMSVLMRFIFKICSNSFTADCGILKVFAQSKISWTVMSAELRSCVLLVKSSSNGSSLMFINSSTCWWSSLVRVMVMGTDTTEEGVVDGGAICVLLVIMIVSLAFRFFKLIFSCLLIGVIVMSLFSISLRIYSDFCKAREEKSFQNEKRNIISLCFIFIKNIFFCARL